MYQSLGYSINMAGEYVCHTHNNSMQAEILKPDYISI